jgi:DNA-binding PadR family transcriptional regulator
MISNWLSKVGSSIPRGYSRRYVLGLLRQPSMLTTKEIIDKAIERSEGRWRPSPGLIYHMLGKLLAEGLIKEMDNGRYSVTKKGIDMLTDIESARNILQKQIDILSQISKVVKLGIDKLSNAGSVLTSILNKIGKRILHYMRNFEELKNKTEQYAARHYPDNLGKLRSTKKNFSDTSI